MGGAGAARPGRRPALRSGLPPEPRLLTWSARVDDLDEAVRSAQQRGIHPGRITPMSRREDGTVLTGGSRSRRTLGGFHPDVAKVEPALRVVLLTPAGEVELS
ncbi:MAG: hypothetical protein ACR2KO_17385 [Geodermatophilaceae bacterium]